MLKSMKLSWGLLWVIYIMYRKADLKYAEYKKE